MRKRASFDLDTKLLKQVKMYAVSKDINLYEAVEKALKLLLVVDGEK